MTTKVECEAAARGLGLSDTTATEESTSDWPPYCYFYRNELYFNTAFGSSASCFDQVQCVCKLPCTKEGVRAVTSATPNAAHGVHVKTDLIVAALVFVAMLFLPLAKP